MKSRGIPLTAIDLTKLPPAARALLPKHRVKQQPEHDMQVALFAWAKEHEATMPELEWLFAVPNWSGRLGRLTARIGAYLKAEGRKPGVPDVWLPVPRAFYHGLVLELKAPGSQTATSKEQKRWIAHLKAAGYRCEVASSLVAAQTIILDYLNDHWLRP